MRAEQPAPVGDSGRLLTRGHPLARAAVRRAIDHERPPHALLLVGPAGVGKSTLAMDLASGVLCTAVDATQRPCRVCAACRKVEHGNHPDLHRVLPEGAGEQIRLPQVLALVSELALMPMEGRCRVAVIESAHRLNPDAQNALLKTLEEPVGAACIVLCADDPSTILPTVVSRTARFRMGPVPLDEIAAMLVTDGLADAPRAARMARASGGLPGRARAMARTPDALLIRERIARQLVDLLAADRRTRLDAAATLMSDGAALEAALEGELVAEPEDGEPSGGRGASRRQAPAERRRAVRRVLTTWRDVGRDLAIVTRGATRRIGQLDLLEELEDAAPLVGTQDLLGFLDQLDGLHAAIDAYASPELVLDALLLRWPRTVPPIAAAPARARSA